MLHKFTFLLTLIFIFTLDVQSQDCTYNVQVYIKDEHNDEPLDFATLWIEELDISFQSNDSGKLTIINFCDGKYHFFVSHANCESYSNYIEIGSDTTIHLYLEHHHESLEEITVKSQKSDNSLTTSKHNISGETLRELKGKTIGEIAATIPGVNVLRSGSTLQKPMIHGMYGNRLIVLNNGIVQEGQQWGNDHAPEMDASLVHKVSVVKGAGALKYGGGAMAGIILTEVSSIPLDPHLHGSWQAIFQSNGRIMSTNFSTEKTIQKTGLRLSGSFKHGGDQHSPKYYLTNTGVREQSIALQVDRMQNEKMQIQFFYSLFHSDIGILRGSHIGNLSDLQDAILRTIPFYTRDTFSYTLNNPRQSVTHHLAKVQLKRYLNDHSDISLIMAYQINDRSEYDVRRGGRSEKPSLALNLNAIHGEVRYHTSLHNNDITLGIQNKNTNNVNSPGTGILPLIPNYRWNVLSAFGIYRVSKRFAQFEIGSRYENQFLNVAFIKDNKIQSKAYGFHSFAFGAGCNFQISKKVTNKIDITIANRPPHVSELFSNGLHQGVSGIEEGNKNLKSETSFKLSDDLKMEIDEENYIVISPYVNRIDNYIYLQPLAEYRLTIRGAFPVFEYKQANVWIYGIDFLGEIRVSKHTSIQGKAALLKGVNATQRVGLIRMPANSFGLKFQHNFQKTWIGNDSKFTLESNYIARQSNVNLGEDFLDPPKAYTLIHAALSSKILLWQKEISISFRIENMLNTSYRDYLNRLRYFADDTGSNISINIKSKF